MAFRFRAQAAIDLRAKQDEDAQRALGVARHATAAAERVRQHEQTMFEDGQARAREEESQSWDTARAIWYRNWIKLQRQRIANADAALEARREEERAVAQAAMDARRRLRSLEHLRDRTLKAYQTAELRAEQKEFDVLGGLRYVARQDVPGGM
jgi:flagellar biosynthesis chaperone FliJ